MADTVERIDPIYITDRETGEEYELDFSRESVKFMANQGFKVGDNLIDFIARDGEEMWYYAFRKNHKKLSRGQTNELYVKMGGLSPKVIERLVLLYNQALMANNIVQDDEDLEKNPRVTVKL